MLKDTSGNPSASHTLAIIAFSVVTLWLVLSIFENIGPIHIRAFSGADAMAYLSPCLMLYWGRRYVSSTPIINGPGFSPLINNGMGGTVFRPTTPVRGIQTPQNSPNNPSIASPIAHVSSEGGDMPTPPE